MSRLRIDIHDAFAPPKHRNCYVAELEFMSGDADRVETIEVVGSFDTIAPAIKFLMAFDSAVKTVACESDFRRLRTPWTTGDVEWDTLPEADVVVLGDDPDTESDDVPNSSIFWPRDTTCDDGDELASLQIWDLFWYDTLGHKHNCTPILE